MQDTGSIVGKRCATLDEIKSQAKIIAEKFNPQKIILFGSCAHGLPDPESDVDLLIVIDSGKSPWETSAEISLIIGHYFPVDILVRTALDIENRLALGDFFIEDIIKKGIVLYERPCKRMD